MLFSCNTGNVIGFLNEDFVSAFFVSHLQRCNDRDLGNHVDKYYMTRMTELKTNEQTKQPKMLWKGISMNNNNKKQT